MTDCIFCKIVNKEIEHNIIYEDKHTLAFLDIRPASKKGGHTLVIPKKHVEFLQDLPDKETQALSLTVKKLTKALMNFAEGVNILENNGKAAGQFVKHVHFHLIPRFKEDHILIEKWPTNEYQNKEEMNKTAEQIKSLL